MNKENNSNETNVSAFSLKKMIYALIICNLTIYVCWSFVSFSFLAPITTTFGSECGRGFYLLFIFVVLLFTSPYYFSFKDM